MQRRGGQRHRRRGQLALLDQRVDGVLAEQAGQDRVADPRVVEVVAAQVRDAGDHPALDQRQPGDVGRDGQRHRDQAAEVGDEALRAGVADVVLDHLADGLVDVALLLAQLGVGGLAGRRQRPDADDRAVQRLADERRGQPGRELGRSWARAACSPRRPPCWSRPIVRCGSYGRCRSSPRPRRGSSPTRATPTRRRPGRHRRRPGARDPAGGVPARDLPDARARRAAADALVLAGAPRASSRSTGCVVSRSLRRSVRDFEIRVDTAFDEVVAGCARPARATPGGSPGTSRRRTASCTGSGWAHSVEAWRDGELAGGLYGVGDRRPVRRRVDVPPGPRRLEGGAGRAWSSC